MFIYLYIYMYIYIPPSPPNTIPPGPVDGTKPHSGGRVREAPPGLGSCPRPHGRGGGSYTNIKINGTDNIIHKY